MVGVAVALAGCAGGAPPDAFTVEAAGARFDVAWDRAAHAADEAAIRAWVTDAAEAIEAWYGRFPIPRVSLQVHPCRGDAAEVGRAHGLDGPGATILLGESAGPDALRDDPVLRHEFAHLAFDLRSEKTWLSEGQASYVEVLARSRAHPEDPRITWATLVRWLRAGLPKPEQGGLDDSDTFERLYCGGLLFWFVADVEIRRRTSNSLGSRDALRAILDAGGSRPADLPFYLEVDSEATREAPGARTPEWMCATGDAATGTTVLAEMYPIWRARPVTPDLDTLFRDLGVIPDGAGGVRLDDAAPLVAIRRAIAG